MEEWMTRTRRRKVPRCHSCHRRALRWLDRRGCYLCDHCGKVFDYAIVVQHNPDAIDPQLEIPTG
jgi:ribosomal protein L37AE/L43A